MHVDVEDLRDFYKSRLGTLVRRRISRHIQDHWQGRKISCLIGLGYAAPYLSLCPDVQRMAALMPDGQGALVWPRSGAKKSVLVREDQLPLPDNSVDQFLMTHCLEVAERPRPMLRELWRVLSPEGRVLIVVPNRRGVWSRLDHTPFGQGSPFSRNQLEGLLVDALLTPEHWASALYFPPLDRRLVVRAAPAIERLGRPIGAAFSGVLIVEARKQLIGPAGPLKSARRLRELVTVRRDSDA